MTREAFELSERLGLPVMIRLVTRLAHSRSTVNPERAIPQPFTRAGDRNTRLDAAAGQCPPALPAPAGHAGDVAQVLRGVAVQPANAPRPEGNHRVRHRPTTTFAKALGRRLDLLDPQDRHLPRCRSLIREIVAHCDEILVVEDGYPYIETRMHRLARPAGQAHQGQTQRGTAAGRRDADGTGPAPRWAYRPRRARAPKAPSVPPAGAVQGLSALRHVRAITSQRSPADDLDPVLFSDIGCYTLGALPPYNAVQSCVDMGSSIAMAHGAAKAGAHPVICTIGDSTFTHSGMTPLIGAAHEDADMTVIILDNATVGHDRRAGSLRHR